ncbi:viroplasmin family protein [Bacillus paralicheniformis]|uniref:ribonuclease H1 domain-containing protein n=1 Tax=Bacillus paralicheniformis TaxID=1648923 RepID=UPI001FD6358E|nr:viroplasmin family protein [Bacillus paralicheniformis]MCJ8223667.1 viroplasmin family protein [Bacillus paralicheniformis]
MDAKQKMYAFVSSDESVTGVYKGYENVPDIEDNNSITVKVTYEDEGQSLVDHWVGLIKAGVPIEKANEYLRKRISGEDKKNPVFFVIFGKRHKGVFTHEEKEIIPDEEKMRYAKKFYTKDAAIRNFEEMCSQFTSAFYLVSSSKVHGIFTDLSLVKQLVHNATDVVIEKYKTQKEAEERLNEIGEVREKGTGSASVYVDGSYNASTHLSGYGFVISFQGKIVYEEKGASLCHNDLKHVNGEIEAVINGIMKSIELGFKKVVIYYDFMGTSLWALRGSRSKKSDIVFVADQYKAFVERARNYIDISFIKLKSHSGDYFNDRADFLAKQGAGNIGLDKVARGKKKHRKRYGFIYS